MWTVAAMPAMVSLNRHEPAEDGMAPYRSEEDPLRSELEAV